MLTLICSIALKRHWKCFHHELTIICHLDFQQCRSCICCDNSHRSSNKVDEEGLELTFCRHVVSLASLNMFWGKSFLCTSCFCSFSLLPCMASPFICMDIACKYWPYLQRLCSDCPELQPLQNMRPFLSVGHAKSHDFKERLVLCSTLSNGLQY